MLSLNHPRLSWGLRFRGNEESGSWELLQLLLEAFAAIKDGMLVVFEGLLSNNGVIRRWIVEDRVHEVPENRVGIDIATGETQKHGGIGPFLLVQWRRLRRHDLRADSLLRQWESRERDEAQGRWAGS